MRRIYDKEARNALALFFMNCATAVKKKQIADADSLGEVANLLRKFVGWIEEQSSGGGASDALESFDFATFHSDFDHELAAVVWRKTGVHPDFHEVPEELTDEEKEADELIGRVILETAPIDVPCGSVEAKRA